MCILFQNVRKWRVQDDMAIPIQYWYDISISTCLETVFSIWYGVILHKVILESHYYWKLRVQHDIAIPVYLDISHREPRYAQTLRVW